MSRKSYESRGGSHWRHHLTRRRELVDPPARSPFRFLYLVIALVVLTVTSPAIAIATQWMRRR